ncbi:hypothetical protein [Viridibacterium curvum]|uniref:hypothetical protein n=1 Tax=Viridibacterium curvum TaxID=1101404 RepID=UPI0031EBE5F3
MSLDYDEYIDLQKTQHQLGCNDECSGEMRLYGPILTRRRTAQMFPDYLKQRDRKSLTRAAKGKKRTWSEANESDDEGTDDDDGLGEATPDANKKQKYLDDDDDDEYLLPATFNREGRLTIDSMEVLASSSNPLAGLKAKSPGRMTVTNAIPGERSKSTNTAMGGIAAWRHARSAKAPNSKRYCLGSKNYYEWCHLHADSLGGSCVELNLVAAHYAVNTYMMIIEAELKGKSGLETEVTAFCSQDDIADWIEYKVFAKGKSAPLLVELIDGRITNFSRSDMSALQGRLKKAGIR